MGTEAQCVAHFRQQSSEGKAQLETDFLLFRGDFRVKIPFKSMKEIAAESGQLRIGFEEGTLQLDLGAAAAKWMLKIRNPPSLMDKVGVKPGDTVSVIGITDESFLSALEAVTPAIHKKLTPKSDLIFAGIESPDDLSIIGGVERNLTRAGALWLIWPKGQRHITEAQVRAACTAANLVDTKTAAFSPTHTALKFVIPVARR